MSPEQQDMRDNINRALRRMSRDTARKIAHREAGSALHEIGLQFTKLGVSANEAAETVQRLAFEIRKHGPIPEIEIIAGVIVRRRIEIDRRGTAISLYSIFNVPVWWDIETERSFK